MYQLFLNQAIASDPPLSALADSRQPPAEPRLQVTPDQELAAIQDEENAILYSYGWVDQNAGIVRLPITRAMELLVERGLPVRGDSDPWL